MAQHIHRQERVRARYHVEAARGTLWRYRAAHITLVDRHRPGYGMTKA